eukprot:Mrub_02919.p1 GENE.Mrub_02919~~Mrub_02919.p1  ORF type:complete len:514 (+),score=112.73 Mrub_02919:29-1543(+)
MSKKDEKESLENDERENQYDLDNYNIMERIPTYIFRMSKHISRFNLLSSTTTHQTSPTKPTPSTELSPTRSRLLHPSLLSQPNPLSSRVSPSRMSKTIDHTQPLITFHYEPRLYHLNKLNYSLKNELGNINNEVSATSTQHSYHLKKVKDEHAQEFDKTNRNMDNKLKYLEDTYENMLKKLSDLTEETKQMTTNNINYNGNKDDDQKSYNEKIDLVQMEILKTQGNIQFARKEEDNLKSEINHDNMSNDDYIKTLTKTFENEKQDVKQKIYETQQTNYSILDNIQNTKNNLGNKLYTLQEEINTLSIQLDSIKKDGDDYKSDYETYKKQIENYKVRNLELNKEKEQLRFNIDKNHHNRDMLKKELLRLDELVYGTNMTINKKLWGANYDKDNYEITNVNHEYLNNSGSPKLTNKNLKRNTSPIKFNQSVNESYMNGLTAKSELHEKRINEIKRKGNYANYTVATATKINVKDSKGVKAKTPKYKNKKVNRYSNYSFSDLTAYRY